MIPTRVVSVYWKTVLDCLVEIHGLRPTRARAAVAASRARLDSAPPEINRDLFYHMEPFDVAGSLAGRQVDRRDVDDVYRAILLKHDQAPGFAARVAHATKRGAEASRGVGGKGPARTATG